MSGYLLAGFVLGIVLIAARIWIGVKEKTRPGLESAVILMVSALSVATGVKVIKICVTADSLKPFADEDRVYIALGGLALIWVSVATIFSALRSKASA